MGQTCHRQSWSSSELLSVSSSSHPPSQSSKPTGNSEAASHRSLRLKGNWLQITDQQDSSRARQPAGRIIISDPAHLDTDSLNLCPQAKDSLIKKAPWGDRGAASVWELLAITSLLSTSPHQHRAVISWQQQTRVSRQDRLFLEFSVLIGWRERGYQKTPSLTKHSVTVITVGIQSCLTLI